MIRKLAPLILIDGMADIRIASLHGHLALCRLDSTSSHCLRV